MPLEKEIPFIKGRRVGPDAIVSRDEQWAARAREANPPRKEWLLSTGSWQTNGSLVVSSNPSTELRFIPVAPLSGILDAVVGRIEIDTVHAANTFTTAIYRYVSDRSSRERMLLKVRNSEVVFPVDNDTKSKPPLDVETGGVATVLPDEQHFIAYRSSGTTLRLPSIPGHDMSHFCCYTFSGLSSGTLPDRMFISNLTKQYDITIPWITYLSKEASILF